MGPKVKPKRRLKRRLSFLALEFKKDSGRGLPVFDSAACFNLPFVQQTGQAFNLNDLVRHDFRIPTTFRVDSPRIQLSSGHLPLPLLNSAFSPSSSTVPAKLVIENGEFHYPWGSRGRELILSNVQLVAKPDARGRIQLKLRSKFGGVAGGGLEIRGFTDPAFHRY